MKTISKDEPVIETKIEPVIEEPKKPIKSDNSTGWLIVIVIIVIVIIAFMMWQNLSNKKNEHV